MKLYGYWRSSSAWRVRIALALKALPHETKPVHLLRGEQRTEEYRELNPLSQVPVLELEEDGKLFRLTQSMAIIEYLEERFPERPLLPAAPADRARAPTRRDRQLRDSTVAKLVAAAGARAIELRRRRLP